MIGMHAAREDLKRKQMLALDRYRDYLQIRWGPQLAEGRFRRDVLEHQPVIGAG